MADNTYLLGDVNLDRQRPGTSIKLFSDYIRANARRLVSTEISSILDLGCGPGQPGFVLHQDYPAARLVAIDRDEQAITVAQMHAVIKSPEPINQLAGGSRFWQRYW